PSVRPPGPGHDLKTMLRRLLATYLAFVLGAGPGLCCCAVVSPSAGTTPAAARDDASAPAGKPSSCCHGKQGPAESERTPGRGRDGLSTQASPPTKSHEHPCPCRENSDNVPLDRAADAARVEHLSPHSLPLAFAYAPISAWVGTTLTDRFDRGWQD